MANRHFGKISEVWKHGVLAEVLDQDRPRRFAETHAGSADYPLTPSPERDYGIYGFMDRRAGDQTLRGSAYARLLDTLPQADGDPRRCPGSPLIAMKTLGALADHLYFDIDPGSVETIAEASLELGIGPHVRAEVRDGCSGVLDTHLDRPEGCVHIDPFDPFESAVPGGLSPVDVARTLANAGTRVLYWYGYEEAGERAWAWEEIAAAVRATRWWIGDIAYAEPETDSGIVGSGMLVGNVSDASVERCESFGRALELIYRDAKLPSGDRGSLAFLSRRSS
jgi:23S rRNA (adenine2030-N6)-methyltransferase